LPSSTKIFRLYKSLLDIANIEYKSVVESGIILFSQSGEPWKLRLSLYDGSFMDVMSNHGVKRNASISKTNMMSISSPSSYNDIAPDLPFSRFT
jgi:hypothetical protein